jgi:DNA repair protein RadA/Sms
MAKAKTRYVCSSCGAVSLKYQGRCSECGSWGTLTEELLDTATKGRSSGSGLAAKPLKLSEIQHIHEERLNTGIEEFNRVLGGGLMHASVTLIGGEPGIGKSTLMLQLADTLQGKRLLYIPAEESAQQIRNRAIRMGLDARDLEILSETQLEPILDLLKSDPPDVVIVDSIQTLFSETYESSPGTVTQVRECTSKLTQLAKKTGFSVFVIGHITKEGAIAGPKVLEHIVDTVLQFEGDNHYRYRILRALKNRFGSTNEIGVFEMTETGLKEVLNPSEAFLSDRHVNISGSCVCAALEGTRPLLVEIQALVSKTNYSVPQRVSSGFDQRRLSLLLAVLEKRLGLGIWSHDVFLNVAGGLKLLEPAVDLAVLTAVASSLRDTPMAPTTLAIGEIGLGGELRAVSHVQRRIMEAHKLGFETVVVPKSNKESLSGSNLHKSIQIRFSSTLSQAFDAIFAS